MAAADEMPLEEILKCGICKKRICDPKDLECSHTFCHDCLDKYVAENEIKKNLVTT